MALYVFSAYLHQFAREGKVNVFNLSDFISITCTPAPHKYEFTYLAARRFSSRFRTQESSRFRWIWLSVSSCLFVTGVFKYPKMHHLLEVCYQRKGLQWKHRVWQKMQARRVANTPCSCLLINNGSYLSFSFCRSSISPNTDPLATPRSLHPTAVLPLEESFWPFSRPLGEPGPSLGCPGAAFRPYPRRVPASGRQLPPTPQASPVSGPGPGQSRRRPWGTWDYWPSSPLSLSPPRLALVLQLRGQGGPRGSPGRRFLTAPWAPGRGGGVGRECRQERPPQPPAETTAPGTPRASPPHPAARRGGSGSSAGRLRLASSGGSRPTRVAPAAPAPPACAAGAPLLPVPLLRPGGSSGGGEGGVVVKAGPGRGGGGGVCVSRSCRRRGRGREPRAGACAQGSPPPPPPSCPRRGGVAGRPPSQSGGEGGERASGRQCARGG